MLLERLMDLCTVLHLVVVHKVRHARGGGVREGVTVCDRAEVRVCDVTLLILVIYMKIESDV